MYSELQTESKDEAIRFLTDHLDHEYANITTWHSDSRYVISVGVGHEPTPCDSD